MTGLKLLITGFGPFPGASVNPTAELVKRLPELVTLSRCNVDLQTHIFPTEWQTVKSHAPDLFQTLRPHICLHFGFHQHAGGFRFEGRARNSISTRADASGLHLHRSAILRCEQSSLTTNMPIHQFAATLKRRKIPVELSNNAGKYLCNYLYFLSLYHAAQSAERITSAFIHVPFLQLPGHPVIGAKGPAHMLPMGPAIEGTKEIIKSAVHHYRATFFR